MSENNIKKHIHINNPHEKDKVEEIIKSMDCIHISDFKNNHALMVRKVLEEYMEDSDMDKERASELTYSEALAMIDAIVTGKTYSYNEIRWCTDKRSGALAHLRSMLLSEKNVTVNKFLSLSVRNFLCCLAERMGLCDMNSKILFMTLQLDIENYIGFSMTEKTTIGELLTELENFQNRPWFPNCNQDYFDSIRNSYESLYYLLIKCYKRAYPQHFDISKYKEN